MSTDSQLTPPLESFSGIPAFLQRSLQVCVRVMPFLLLCSVVVGAFLLGFGSVSSVLQQAGFGWQYFLLLLAFIACWILLISALNVFVATVVSVALGATALTHIQALAVAARRLPWVVGYSVLTFFTVAAGFVCLVLPGIYLTLRLFPVVQVALFEPNVNVFKRCWELTQYRTLEVFISYVVVFAGTIITSVAVGALIGFLPSFPGLALLGTTLQILLTYTIPLVFWLSLYGWFRADIYVPPVTSPEEVYAEA